jgi:hypothetical protein
MMAGALVGLKRRLPELWGAVGGLLAMSLVALVVGPKDGWMVLWLVFYGGSGAIGGLVTGAIGRGLV